MKKGKSDEKNGKDDFPKILYVTVEDDGEGTLCFAAATELCALELIDNEEVAVYRLERAGRASLKTEIV